MRAAYEKTSVGATIDTPFGDASWAPGKDYWGHLTDKFGVTWEFAVYPINKYL
ncbi:MAG: hypothetical protein FWD83_08670 [Promicromonosporaceae bacterium]|nr:hypothetical protein [Promicromonosporaceae bacterium]